MNKTPFGFWGEEIVRGKSDRKKGDLLLEKGGQEGAGFVLEFSNGLIYSNGNNH